MCAIIVAKIAEQSWKKVSNFYPFMISRKGAHHILTFKGGKLKFSQNMQVKEMFSKCLLPKS